MKANTVAGDSIIAADFLNELCHLQISLIHSARQKASGFENERQIEATEVDDRCKCTPILNCRQPFSGAILVLLE